MEKIYCCKLTRIQRKYTQLYLTSKQNAVLLDPMCCFFCLNNINYTQPHVVGKEVVVVAVFSIAPVPVCGWAEGDNLSPIAQCDHGD